MERLFCEECQERLCTCLSSNNVIASQAPPQTTMTRRQDAEFSQARSTHNVTATVASV